MIKQTIKALLDSIKLSTARALEYKHTSFSQCGEDIIVDYVFKLRGIDSPTYLDIGANHPFFLNNTAIFYNRGCRGVNIEANPVLLDNFQKYRPDDINLNIGVGAEESTLDFYIINDSTLSTFSKHEADKTCHSGRYRIESVEPVKMLPVKNILSQYYNDKFPDFLSLDVEGLDLDILKSIDFKMSYPKIICVEAAEYSPRGDGQRRQELIDFLSNQEYIEYANTNLNAIMVRKEFWMS